MLTWGEEKKARKCSRASFGCKHLRVSALRASVFACAPLALCLCRLLEPSPSFCRTCLHFQLGALQGRVRRGSHWVNTVGADPLGVTLATAVQASMREGGGLIQAATPCTRHGTSALWVSSSSTSVAPPETHRPWHMAEQSHPMQLRALSGFGNDLWFTSSRHSQYC